MEADNRTSSRRVIAALDAASALRRAAMLTRPANRVEAVWEGLGRLRPAPAGADSIVERLEDDGRGDRCLPDARLLLASARGLEEIAATATGIVGGGRPASGRVRSPALRADRPTTRERTRARHRRRLRSRGRRVA